MPNNCDKKTPAPPIPYGATEGVMKYWEAPLHELGRVDIALISPEWAERHRIYSLLTMALIFCYWNGNKSGAVGNYPWRESQEISPGAGRYHGDKKFGDRYLGHNIACIAVDENGELIDFEFNHNDLYNSSTEHAESRLIRRIFTLNQIYDHWQTESETGRDRIKYDAVFNGTTIYTSLESCAQCSGIMTLANAKRVVYLQDDPGQYLVGNILYNLTRPQPKPQMLHKLTEKDTYTRPAVPAKYYAPEPVNATLFGFTYKQRLETAYQDFAIRCGGKKKAFFIGSKQGDQPVYTKGITSFLCTDDALYIFKEAADELGSLALTYPDFAPARSDNVPATYTNSAALEHARKFLAHAANQGNRGTPHR